MGRNIYIVIGGSGFLGRHIVEALLQRGDTVSVLDIVQRHDDVPFYFADISEQAQVEEALTKSQATCIIHTASPPHGMDPTIYYKVNVDGTKAIVAAARAVGVKKLVFTSSAGVVFNGQDLNGVDERVPYPDLPLDAYNDSKAKAEELVLSANGVDGLKTVALRPAGIFGPGDRQVMHGLMQVFYNKQTHWQIGDNKNLFDFTYVTNVAKAHLLAADRLSEPLTESDKSRATSRSPSRVSLTVEDRPVPTSKARPIGPTVALTEDAKSIQQAYLNGDRSDPEPVVERRSAESALDEEDPYRVDGQAFFITNGEPVYFWDFMRIIWRAMGDPLDKSVIIVPRNLGIVLATLAEFWSWLVGKEPAFTRFRVILSCATRWHSINRARRALGYEPEVGLLDGVNRMIDWYKKEHMSQ